MQTNTHTQIEHLRWQNRIIAHWPQKNVFVLILFDKSTQRQQQQTERNLQIYANRRFAQIAIGQKRRNQRRQSQAKKQKKTTKYYSTTHMRHA